MVNKTVVGSSLEGDLEGGKEEAPGHSTTILHPDRMLWVSRWAPGELRGGSRQATREPPDQRRTSGASARAMWKEGT